MNSHILLFSLASLSVIFTSFARGDVFGIVSIKQGDLWKEMSALEDDSLKVKLLVDAFVAQNTSDRGRAEILLMLGEIQHSEAVRFLTENIDYKWVEEADSAGPRVVHRPAEKSLRKLGKFATPGLVSAMAIEKDVSRMKRLLHIYSDIEGDDAWLALVNGGVLDRFPPDQRERLQFLSE